MRKMFLRFLVLGLIGLGLPTLSKAQTFEAIGNPNVVAGASYLTTDPGTGLARTHFLLTANLAGIKVGSLPLYVGGVGVDLRTIDQAFSSISGVGLSVPVATFYFGNQGGQFLAQVGYSRDLTGDVKSNGIYAGFGFSLTSPKTMAAKRAAKKAAAAAAKKAELLPLPTAN